MPIKNRFNAEPTSAVWSLILERTGYGLRYFVQFLRVYPGYAAGYVVVLTVALAAAVAPVIAPGSR